MDKNVTTHLKINEERHKNRLSSRTFVHLQDSSRQNIKDFQVHVSSSIYDFGNVSPEDIIMGNILLQNQEIPFVQLKTTTNISSALKLMIKTWNIYAPQAVLVLRSDLCFLTGENEIKLGDKLAESIIKAAFNVHRMWMCTHGLNTGFSKIIGKAFNEANVTNRVHHLEKDSDLPLQTTESSLIGICEKNVYNNPIQQCQKFENDLICYDEVDLNPYHSHFIFVTDEVPPAMNYDYFFSKFECGLKDYQPPILSMKPKVPVIALLVGGKETCIDYLLLHMQQCLPVLVIYGSGGFADIVAFAYFEISRSGLRTTDSEYHENLLKPILCRKICVAFPHLNEKLYDYLVDNIFKCIYNLEKETSEYLYILDAHGHSTELERLSYHMLCALFKSQRKNIVQWHLQMKSDLLLTIDWNCPDVALSEVFLMYPKFTVTSSIFESVLFTKDREAFVSLFLQRGFKLHNFLSSNQLVSILQKSKKEKFFYDVCWKGFLHCEEVFDINAEFIDLVLNSFIYCLTNLPFHISSEELDLNAIGIYSTKLEKHEESILAEQKAISLLMVWALISNRIKLAHVLLHFTGMPVITAFICSIILNHLLPFVTDVSMRSTISMESKRFCEIANGVFSKAYDIAPGQTWKKLAVKNPIWGDYTLAQVALMVQNYDFLSQECFQKWTTQMYMGRIRMIELPRYWFKVPVCLKVMLSAIFIVPIYFWISFEHKPILSEKPVSNVNSEGHSQETAMKNNFRKLSDILSSAEQPHKIEATPSKSYLQNLPLWKMIMIMWTTPITKFWTSYILYIFFLAFFCFTTIWPACDQRYMDLCLAIWIASLIIEKIHCFSSSQMIYSHSVSFLKRIEIVYMCVFIFFILVNHIHEDGFQSYSHKIIHCFGLLFFFYRIMYTYMPMFFTLGPLMYRFKVIVFVEAMHYMCLIFFVMISNGIVVETLLHPDYPYTMELLRRAIQRGWIQLFISIPYKVTKNQVRCLGWEKQPLNDTECRVSNNYDYDCPYIDTWSYFFILHYMIIAKLVFWPLFFAFVNYANSKLATESEQHWNAYRYLLISEYAYSRPLPAPFNLFYYILYALKYVFCLCCHQMSKCKCWNKKNKNEQSMILKPFSFGHHSFWKQVFFEYIDEQEDSQKGSQYSKNKLNMISEFQEGVKYQEKTIYKAKSQVAELEADVTYTRLFAQTSKYWVEQDKVPSFSIHVLSRCSPYHGMNIERYPVPDKYVPWDVKWLNYEPTVYTASNAEFPEHLQWFADINIFRSDLPEGCSEFHERYEMRWNMNYTDSHGVYKRRKSWIKHNDHNLIYMLYHGMPQNPQGRTGLSGKGFLLQWGPNHYVYLIITRFKKLRVNDQVEFVAVNVRNVLSLPGGFARSRNRYMAVRDFFTADWETETDMKEFFESCIIKSNDDDDDSDLVECKMIKRGYMDNPLNTDNAWREVELWHVHYKAPTNVNVYFKPDLFWCTVDEKLFRKLPQGQFYLLKLVLRRLDIIREHD